MKTGLGPGVSYETSRRSRLVIVSCAFVAVLAGCGPPASDPVSGLDSRAATGKTANVSATSGAEIGAQTTGQASDARVSGRGDHSGQTDKASTGQPAISGKSDGTTDERNTSLSPNIPETVAKDLGSPDARVRYHALDYWETQQDQPPLIPVFEAMEDEDPAVRAKAATIVEQRMDLEQEQEGG